MTSLQNQLETGRFVITTELTPPKGTNLSSFQQAVDSIKNLVDGINVTDNHRASMRLSSLVAAHKTQQWGGEPIVQMTCRDMNRLAIQSQLLGCSVLDLPNVLMMHGDDPTKGEQPETKGIFDLDTLTILNAAKTLNSGKDLGEKTLNGPTNLFPGATVSPCDDDQEFQLKRFKEKIEAGAQFFQTQPIFEPEKLQIFLQKTKEQEFPNFHLIAGILPLKSVKTVDFLNEKVPGISINDTTRSRMEDRDYTEGFTIARELIKEIKPYVAGIHVMAIGLEEQLPEFLESLQNLRK